MQIMFMMKWIPFYFAALLFCSSCEEKSVIGKWTDADKKSAKVELMQGFNSSDGAENIPQQLKEDWCDCVVSEIEKYYPTFEEANKDQQGIMQYSRPCLEIFRTAVPRPQTENQVPPMPTGPVQ